MISRPRATIREKHDKIPRGVVEKVLFILCIAHRMQKICASNFQFNVPHVWISLAITFSKRSPIVPGPSSHAVSPFPNWDIAVAVATSSALRSAERWCPPCMLKLVLQLRTLTVDVLFVASKRGAVTKASAPAADARTTANKAWMKDGISLQCLFCSKPAYELVHGGGWMPSVKVSHHNGSCTAS